jgi:pantothenate kinase
VNVKVHLKHLMSLDSCTYFSGSGEKKRFTFPTSTDRPSGPSTAHILIPNHHDLVIVEGNYLLLDEPVWRDLDDYWDLAVFVQIGLETIKTRLMQRWKAHGFDRGKAARWIESNDIPNAERVLKNRVPEDVTLHASG